MSLAARAFARTQSILRLISRRGSLRALNMIRSPSRQQVLSAEGLAAFLVVAAIAWAEPVASYFPGPASELRIIYLGKRYAEPQPLSPTDSLAADNGYQGARLGVTDDNSTGRLLGQHYQLIEAILDRNEDAAAKARTLLADGNLLIVADLEPPDLLAVADLPDAGNAIILDVRTSDDVLRQEQCRRNVFHMAPAWSMRADALAQYLHWKRWPRWLLVTGSGNADSGFTKAVRRAASRFDGNIVAERTNGLDAGSPRSSAGHQLDQVQMPLLTRDAPDHDVVFVVDLEERFGEYLPFNTSQARPVVGTQGLTAVAWHRSFAEDSGSILQSRFARLAGRDMTERDYAAWLAVRSLGEAATRTGSTGADALRRHMLSDRFALDGYKGMGLTFRRWDQQLRQPILLSGPRALVSISPQDGFQVDTLGFDAGETACRLSP